MVFGNNQGEAVLDPEFNNEKVVSFLDFVQALAIRAITTSPKSRRIAIPKIRQAVEKAKSEYKVDFPLAMQHKIFVFGNDLIIKNRQDEYVGLTGKHSGNKMFTEIAELYMRKLDFGEDGLSNLYRAWGSGKSHIVMNPKVQFGEPVFLKYGLTAHTLFHAVETEGSVANAAKCYEVPESIVYTAMDYFDHLELRSAA